MYCLGFTMRAVGLPSMVQGNFLISIEPRFTTWQPQRPVTRIRIMHWAACWPIEMNFRALAKHSTQELPLITMAVVLNWHAYWSTAKVENRT